MAYGKKYQMSYTGLHAQETTVIIYQDGFPGSVTDFNQLGDRQPVSVSWEGQTSDSQPNKYTPVRGSEAVIYLWSTIDFQYNEFFDIEDDEYRVDILKDGGLWWRGWVVPELKSEPYGPPPYPVMIRAVDGLARLKNIDFTIPSTTRQSKIKTLFDCLDVVGSEMSVYEAVDVYETTMTISESASPLSQAEIDTNGFVDSSGDVSKCYTVLEEILKPSGAVLRQNNGAWWIVMPNNQNETFHARKWDAWNDLDLANSYVNVGLGDYNPVVNHGTDVIALAQDSEKPSIPAYKKHTIEFTAGVPTNIIPDGEFELGAWTDANNLNKWTKNGGITIERVAGSGEFSTYAMSITSREAASIDTNKYVESSAINVAQNAEISFRFKYKVAAVGGAGFFFGFYQLRLVPANGDPNQYLQDDYTWGTTDNQIQWNHSEGTGWRDAIIADENGEFFSIPKTGALYIRFYSPVCNTSWGWTGLFIDSAVSQLKDSTALPTEFEFWFGTNSKNYSYERSQEEGQNLEVRFGDVSQFAAFDFDTGTKARLDFDIDFASPTDGDQITFDVNGTARTYTYKITPTATREFDTIDRLMLTSLPPDLGTDYLHSQFTDLTTTVTIIATAFGNTFNFGTVSRNPNPGGTFSNITKVDNQDPSTSNETGLHRGSITINNGAVSQNWKREGVTESKKLLEILTQRIMNNYARPTEMIIGQVEQKTGTPLPGMILRAPVGYAVKDVPSSWNFAGASRWSLNANGIDFDFDGIASQFLALNNGYVVTPNTYYRIRYEVRAAFTGFQINDGAFNQSLTATVGVHETIIKTDPAATAFSLRGVTGNAGTVRNVIIERQGSFMMQGGIWLDRDAIWSGEWVEIIDKEETFTITSDIRPQAGTSVTTSVNNTTIINTGGGSVEGLQELKAVVTAAQLGAIGTTDVILIPAPAVSTQYIQIVYLDVLYKHGGTSYDVINSLQLRFGAVGFQPFAVQPDITSYSANRFFLGGPDKSGTSWNNSNTTVRLGLDLRLQSNFSSNPTQGNGTLEYYILYRTIETA